MEVSTLIASIKSGDLKKLFLKNSDTDILGFINSGIVEIYKRFPLSRDSIPITPTVGVKDYKFNGEDLNVPIDVDETQLLLIEEITATDPEGEVFTFIPTNATIPANFSTPSYNTLRIHSDYELHTLAVEVRLVPATLISTSDDLPLPPQFLEMLTLYVAYKAHSSVSADVKGENNTYYMRFTKAVADTALGGQYPLDPLDVSLLDKRGFV